MIMLFVYPFKLHSTDLTILSPGRNCLRHRFRCGEVYRNLTQAFELKVFVAEKGYAAQNGVVPVLDQPLSAPVTTSSATGGVSGGWPLTFLSPSGQFGSEPSEVCVKLAADVSGMHVPRSCGREVRTVHAVENTVPRL